MALVVAALFIATILFVLRVLPAAHNGSDYGVAVVLAILVCITGVCAVNVSLFAYV